MFVVDVCTLVDPSLLRMSAGSPESRSVMATKEDHVRLAYSWRSPRSRSRAAAGAASSSESKTAGSAMVWTLTRIRPSRTRPPLSSQKRYPVAPGTSRRRYGSGPHRGKTRAPLLNICVAERGGELHGWEKPSGRHRRPSARGGSLGSGRGDGRHEIG